MSFGGSIKLTGETEYQRALKTIKDNLTLVSSEMKVVTSLYDKNDTSTAKLTAQNEVLNKKLAEQQRALAEAKKMLDQAKASKDADATTIAKWQAEFNKAQAEVNKTTREINNNNKVIAENEKKLDDAGNELKEFAENENKAGEGAVKFGDLLKANVLGDFIVGGIKAIGSAMATVGKAFIDVGKQALDSFADYQQLVGGVDTLFKDSSAKVQEYASNAFKTAGINANTYMETVTSFSASLLSALNGDTAKSAEIADMAIIDMADNANKMGTDLTMIQNAYQGFAKQNYTMLDNLKLGYGGTKGEMERLLQDATAISGVEYDITQLNDVFEAIHIIQGELGITGATALEASTTISGSLNTMKGAWDNLLTGIADKNANVSELVGNLVDSVVVVANNIVPVIATILPNLVLGLTEVVSSLGGYLPEIISTLIPVITGSVQTLLGNLSSMLPQLLPIVVDAVMMTVQCILENLPLVIDAGIQILLSLVQGIGQSLPTLIPTAISAVLTVVDNLISNIDLLIDAGISLIMGLAEGLINAIPVLVEKIPIIIENLLSALYRNEAKLLSAGIQLVVQVGVGLVRAIPELLKAVPEIIKSLVNGFGKGVSDMWSVGGDLIKGLINGIKNFDFLGEVKSIADRLVGNFKSFFGIRSPSKLFENEIGNNLALGVGKGFESTMKDVNADMQSAVKTDYSFNMTGNSTTPTTMGMDYDTMVSAFTEALRTVKIVLNEEVAGEFVTDTITRVVYS